MPREMNAEACLENAQREMKTVEKRIGKVKMQVQTHLDKLENLTKARENLQDLINRLSM
jgi:hypothetical protein